jgi:signal transduction histidine kinase/cytochrome c553
MKKKVIIGLTIFSLIFLLSSVYTIATIEHATGKIDSLINLYRVETLRERLLIELSRAQSELHPKSPMQAAKNTDRIAAHATSISAMIATCFACHHNAAVTARLNSLRKRTDEYTNGLMKLRTMSNDTAPQRLELDQTFRLGAELVSEVDAVTTMTNHKLENRTQAAFQEVGRTKMMLYLLVVTVPFAAIALSVFFIRGFSLPVQELLTATRRLKNGDLEYRIEGLPDEFGEVAASFNEMAKSLREERLRMQWTEQLMVLGEMVGGLAHEIKNPLAGIKASVDVLSCDPSLNSENRFIIMKVAEQIKRIEGLIKNVLNFARPPKPQFLLVDVNSIIDSSVGLAERHPAFASRSDRRITILKDFDSKLPETMADPVQLQQVIVNLLLNSADAMPEQGSITIHTEKLEQAGSLRITLTDTGKGIDDAILNKIFQPFFTTKPSGTGLGLAITKGLVEQHRGTINVKNNKDRGVTFTITLPIRSLEEVAIP